MKTNGQLIDPVILGLTVSRIIGAEASCLCPFHSDRHPSASFNMISGKFYCFTCQEPSTAAELKKVLDGDIVRVFRVLNVNESAEKEWQWTKLLPLATGNAYLNKRSVSWKAIETFGIRETKEGIVFPIHDLDGVQIGAQIRRYNDIHPRYFFVGQKGPLWPIQNLSKYNPRNSMFIVEGIFGVLRAFDAGQLAVTPLGAGSIASLPLLTNGMHRRVIYDNDFAGHLGAAKILATIPAMAMIPGEEADELSVAQWQNMGRFEWTSDWRDLAEISGDAKRIRRLVGKMLKWQK